MWDPPAVSVLATATTSATFYPHCEQRIRVASAARVYDCISVSI